jgi:hypothetical protein
MSPLPRDVQTTAGSRRTAHTQHGKHLNIADQVGALLHESCRCYNLARYIAAD